MKATTALLALGKSDLDAIEDVRSDRSFKAADGAAGRVGADQPLLMRADSGFDSTAPSQTPAHEWGAGCSESGIGLHQRLDVRGGGAAQGR